MYRDTIFNLKVRNIIILFYEHIKLKPDFVKAKNIHFKNVHVKPIHLIPNMILSVITIFFGVEISHLFSIIQYDD